MSGFSSAWLSLREPADRAARNRTLIAELLEHCGAGGLRVTDLGCGTGSTSRALSEYLQADCNWLLVDRDPALLEEAVRQIGPKSITRTLQADLAGDLEAVLHQPADLVTGSALIDLVSEDWLHRLIDAAPANACLYFALIYDGDEVWQPPHPAESRALAAFHDHQRGDKGFGPALGPDASRVFARILRSAGYEVRLAHSPWRLSDANRELIEELARGGAIAVEETGQLEEAELAEWYAARHRARHVLIGHQDLLAFPSR